MIKENLVKILNKIPVHQAIIHIYTTYNNTIINVTSLTGHTLLSASRKKIIKNRKSARYSTKVISKIIGFKIKELGFKNIRVRLKGMSYKLKSLAVKGLKVSGLKISKIRDITPIAHNGCRPKRCRRI
jgi:small subunit ribosomal protein S11